MSMDENDSMIYFVPQITVLAVMLHNLVPPTCTSLL